MCKPNSKPVTPGDCGCCCGPFPRRFMSTDEKQEMLEDYKDQLEKELTGVKERIQELANK